MADQFRVLLTDRAWPDFRLERDILKQINAAVIEAPDHDEPTLVDLARDVDAIGACWAQVTESVIQAAPRCRTVARFGIGLDNIAVATATRLGIPVTNVPDYCVEEVSDHALALLLACARKVAFFHLRTKYGEYNLQQGPPLRRLAGQTLGLVGLGRIAKSLVPKARALGLNVIAHTRSSNPHQTGCQMVSFDDLLGRSDYISLHLPLSDASHHRFGTPEFQKMKRTAYLINTSRGPLIDHNALFEALEQNLIAGAALDVFEPEPPDLGHPLYQHERVIVTPHVAFLSEESLIALRTAATQQIADVLQGNRPRNVVNPEIYSN